MDKQARQLQIQLGQAITADLDILEKYKRKEVVMSLLSDNTIGGIINDYGHEFIYLTNCKEYDADINHIVKHNLRRKKDIPNRTIAKRQIQKIVLLEDLIKSIEQK